MKLTPRVCLVVTQRHLRFRPAYSCFSSPQRPLARHIPAGLLSPAPAQTLLDKVTPNLIALLCLLFLRPLHTHTSRITTPHQQINMQATLTLKLSRTPTHSLKGNNPTVYNLPNPVRLTPMPSPSLQPRISVPPRQRQHSFQTCLRRQTLVSFFFDLMAVYGWS